MKTVFENCLLMLPGRKVAEGDVAFDDESGLIEDVSLDRRRGQGGRPPSRDGRRLDLSGHLVMPGLVNCHCHAAMTLVRGLGGGLPLQRWLTEAIFPVEAKMTADDVYAGTMWGAMEMLAGGTTCVADMYDFPEAAEKAFADAGIESRVCRVGLAFPDGTPPGRLGECVRFCRGKAEGRDICVHSEYLTDEGFCRALADANRELGRRLHVHVSETRREHDECVARHGKTPVAYLAGTGLFDHGGYAAHCVWCTDDDFRIMAERGVALVHNPTSNMKLGSGFARVMRAMELGVCVALGTDGPASNDNLDMFEEMHLASLVHKGLANDPTVLSPWDVVEMATKNGARALGRGDAGEIAAGKRADFCVVDLGGLHLAPALDVPNLVVHSIHAGDVAATYVGGRKVYDRGSFSSVDAEGARKSLMAAVARLGLVDALATGRR